MRITVILKLLAVVVPFTFARSWTSTDECPTNIKTTVSSDRCNDGTKHCTDKPEFRNMDAVHTALLNCPNIKTLDLRVTVIGCSDGPSRWDFPFNPAGGENYPNLTSLRLEGYDFGNHPVIKPPPEPDTISRWYRNIMATIQPQRTEQTILNPAPKTNLDLWLDAMNWSHLKELKLDDDDISSEVLFKLPPRLTSLQKLETTNTSFITALPKNTLTHLKWVGGAKYHKDLPTILAHHSSSLRSLEFRKPEEAHAPFIPIYNIELLEKMKRLTHLAINVPRNGSWPFSTLDKISSLPDLESADLYMNIASACAQQRPFRWTDEYSLEGWRDICVGEEQFQQPYVNEQGAREVFKYMREKKEGKALKELTFWLGDWKRGWDGPLYEPQWLEGKRAKVVCVLDDVDVGEEVCKFEVGHECWDEEDEWCEGDVGDEYWADEEKYWSHY